MLTQPISQSPNFGYKSILKKEFERGAIPLKRDITGKALKRGYSSVDKVDGEPWTHGSSRAALATGWVVPGPSVSFL